MPHDDSISEMYDSYPPNTFNLKESPIMADYSIERYQFETGIYRPPSEGGSSSLLLRFTRNCPWNHCAFCSMYKGEKFQLEIPW